MQEQGGQTNRNLYFWQPRKVKARKEGGGGGVGGGGGLRTKLGVSGKIPLEKRKRS